MGSSVKLYRELLMTPLLCRSWFGSYLDSQEVPNGYWITEIEGKIPPELSGTFFRCEIFTRVDVRDAFCFKEWSWEIKRCVGSIDASVRCRWIGGEYLHQKQQSILSITLCHHTRVVIFVQLFCLDEFSRHLLEVDAGKRLFKGAFGTHPNVQRHLQFHSRNAANTNIMLWKKHLWTLYECAQPYELDPYTLRTLGPAKESFLPQGAIFDTGCGTLTNQLLSRMHSNRIPQPPVSAQVRQSGL